MSQDHVKVVIPYVAARLTRDTPAINSPRMLGLNDPRLCKKEGMVKSPLIKDPSKPFAAAEQKFNIRPKLRLRRPMLS